MPAATLALPGRIDLSNARELTATIAGLRGQDVVLDGSAVERIGGLGAQILHAAFRTWREDGHGLHLSEPSDALVQTLHWMGFPDTDLSVDAAA